MSRVFADVDLARRLERGEGKSNADFVEARAAVEPDVGAEWIEVAGAYAMFDGPDSFCTQTFGLGVFESPSDADLDRIEGFYTERGAATNHEMCPLAGAELLGRLGGRGYRVVETSNVLFQPLVESAVENLSTEVRIVETSERSAWARTAAEGWSDVPGAAEFLAGVEPVLAAKLGDVCFLAERDGRPVAAGALSLQDGVALFAGASTIPSERRRGAQKALLKARLSYARRQGCDLAMVVAEPGSSSQRNAERNGFRVAYTRTKWTRPLG